MIGYGNDIAKAQRASTNSPTSNVVLQKERYFAFKFDGQVTTSLDLQCLTIKHVTGLVMDQNEYWPHVQKQRQEQWEACITRTGGSDYYLLDLLKIASKFWNVFGLQEDIDPDEIQGQILKDVIDKLYAMLWQSHVIPPPPGQQEQEAYHVSQTSFWGTFESCQSGGQGSGQEVGRPGKDN